MHCPVCRLPDLFDPKLNPENYCVTGGAAHGKCVYLLEDIFEDLADGILPSKRDNQYALAKAVAKALSYPSPETSALLVEGGTGLGKTYGYLIPIILDMQELIRHNKQNPNNTKKHRAIISTANKALQTQLSQKDVPTLIKAIDPTLKFCSIKGNTNYACLATVLLNPTTAQQKKYMEFITKAGIAHHAAELSNWDGPVPPWWSDCSVEHCSQAKGCPHYSYCKPRIKDFDIVVTNHAKLGYGLRYDNVLGDFKTLVMDEAHQGPSYFRSAFELECDTSTVETLLSQMHSDQVLNDVWQDLESTHQNVHAWASILHELRNQFRAICANMEIDAAGIVKARYEITNTAKLENNFTYFRSLENFNTLRVNLEEHRKKIHDIQQVCTDRVNLLASVDAAWYSYEFQNPGASKNSSDFRRHKNDSDYSTFTIDANIRVRSTSTGSRSKEEFTINDFTRTEYAHALRFITKFYQFIYVFNLCMSKYSELLNTFSPPQPQVLPRLLGNALVLLSEYNAKTKDVELTLKLTPYDLGAHLNQCLEKIPVRIAMSATMTVEGNFTYMAQNLGFRTRAQDHTHHVDTQRYASPFDYTQQVLTWLPTTIPLYPISVPSTVSTKYLDPSHPYELWCKAQIDVIYQAVKLCNGNIFVLFSSTQNMKAIHKRLMDYKDWPEQNPIILHDGNADSALRSYHSNDNAVLLGCKSFWEGIDIPGDKLKGIIITQLPFGHPGNLELALLQKIAFDDKDKFMNIAYPYMLFQLLQGTGRLIRTMTDTGILVISDPRIKTANYGPKIQKNLPVIRTVTSDFTKLKKNYIERGY